MSTEQLHVESHEEEQPGIVILDEPRDEHMQASFPRPLYLDRTRAFVRDQRSFPERHQRLASLASAIGDAVSQLSNITGRGYHKR